MLIEEKGLNKTIWGERESKECNRFKREGNIESVLKTCRKRWKRQARYVCTYGSVAVTFCRTFHQGHVFSAFSLKSLSRAFSRMSHFPALFCLLRIFFPPFLLFPVFYQVHDVSTNKTLSRCCSLPLFRPLLWSIRRSVLSLAVRLLCLRLGFP